MLTSLAQIKNFLNISGSDTSQDLQLEAIQLAAESVIKNRIKRDLELTAYTEFYAGNSQRSIVLRKHPVISIQSVHEDFQAYYGYNANSFGPNTLLLPGLHYTLDIDTDTVSSKSGLLVRIGGIWMEAGRVYYPGKLASEIGPTYGNLKIQYTAGLSVIPQDIQYAICLLVSSMRRNVSFGTAVSQEDIGDYTYKLFDVSNQKDALLGSVEQILTRYREQAI